MDENKENEKIREKVKEVEELFFKLRMYPVAVNFEEKENIKKKIKKIYREGNEKIKQIILYMFHETLMDIVEIKFPKNFENMKKRYQQLDAYQIRMKIYRSVFNYTHSLEGIEDIIFLLSELEDGDSAKLLTHYFSFLSQHDNVSGVRMVKNIVVKALGRHKSSYALHALLSYIKNSEDEYLKSTMIKSIKEWVEKIDNLKISKKEKSELKKKLGDVLIGSKGREGHYR